MKLVPVAIVAATTTACFLPSSWVVTADSQPQGDVSTFRPRPLSPQEQEASHVLAHHYYQQRQQNGTLSSSLSAGVKSTMTPTFGSLQDQQLNDDDEQQQLRRLQFGPKNTKQLPVLEIIAQSFLLRLFEAYLGFGLLIPALQGTGPFTVLAPMDFWWNNLDAALIAKLQKRSWVAHLQNLLRYHMYMGDLSPENLPSFSSSSSSSSPQQGTFLMANGEEAVFRKVPNTTSRV